MKFQRQLSNGRWTDESDPNRIKLFTDLAIQRESWYAERVNREPMTTQQQIFDYLATGKTLRYDDDWYAEIRDASAIRRAPVKQPVMVKCACGHECEQGLVMSASLGTSCPDCYDRMSD